MGSFPFRSAFEGAFEALLRPLDFSGDPQTVDSTHLQGLEESVQRACRRLRTLALPRDLLAVLAQVEKAFSAPLDREATAAAVKRARERLQPYRGPHWCDEALARSVGWLPGIGPKRAEVLAKRDLASVADLLYHLPTRYDDRRDLVRVGDLQVGQRATFIGEVLAADLVNRRTRGGRFRRVLQAEVGDESGTIGLRWFRGGESLAATVAKGTRLLVTGDVRRNRFSKELVHPEVDALGEVAGDAPQSGRDFDSLRRIVPVYSTPDRIYPRALRRLVERALEEYVDLLPGHLPESLVRERGLPDVPSAMRLVHAPGPNDDVERYRERRSAAHERLVLDELFLLEVGLALRRAQQARLPAIAIDVGAERVRRAPDSLPFRLTGAQARCWEEIRRDLAQPHPMNRLLQGDVGSGKTAVAYLAAVAVAGSGLQSALMAPTELLAEQHARTLERLAAGSTASSRLRVGLFTASVPRSEAEEVRNRLEAGEIDLVVGTHALLQPEIRFARLALAVVDEQHRFGVLQRRALATKAAAGGHPHILVMTATPIPRTLALTLYGDLDLSVIDELPPGRIPVKTLLLREGEGKRIIELIQEAVGRGEQTYVVYPLVEESEKIDLRSASESTERIRSAFPKLRVDLLHGRMDATERASVMGRFERGESDLLVSTTVIEVGVDIAGATLMVVEHAERFGLAQLHQLRGRVGRGGRPGTCVLMVRATSEVSEARLRAMLDTQDGFEIADADLRIRGPGEFLGTRQHGHFLDLRVADLVRDARLVSVAREAALSLLRRDPGLRRDPALRRAAAARWGERLALVDVG
ncbi:MAG: ATP-dependent DNA helicase RecG [Myxococcota bacterium]